MHKPKLHFGIWGLALGYFIFYVPYSGMTKALSTGLFSNSFGSIPGFEILPTVLLGTVLGFLIILWTTGWWKHAGTIKLFGKNIPFVTSRYTFLSGIATAIIIATTTLAYSFTGVSIVFAALLMRGGVLLLALFVDIAYKRKIQWYSWLAFALTLLSLFVGFSQISVFDLSMAAGINIAAYLAGYFFRLQFMTYVAKTSNTASTYKYFVEEMFSATMAILFLPLIFAWIGRGETMLILRAGYLSFGSSGLMVHTLVIGMLYSCLYVFGSRIYLDQRENTFCIPVNRCASLLAGIVAAVLLSAVYEKQFYTTIQLLGAVILVFAILTLNIPQWLALIGSRVVAGSHHYIFVCPGNTGRSAMAQYICMNRMVARLQSYNQKKKENRIRVWSAAITGEEGIPIHQDARKALEYLGVPVKNHKSRKLSAENIIQAEKIWCMSPEQKQIILDKFPEAQGKVSYLEEEDPIPVPHGRGVKAYIECARKLERIIDNLIVKKEIVLS